MTQLTPDQLSSALYDISLKGYHIVTESEGDEWGYSYAVVDGRVVISAGATIEDAVEDYHQTQNQG